MIVDSAFGEKALDEILSKLGFLHLRKPNIELNLPLPVLKTQNQHLFIRTTATYPVTAICQDVS